MKFSLKDLMWSATLASCGLGCLAYYLRSGTEIGLLPLFLMAPILCAALGSLMKAAEKGFWIGVLVGYPILMVLGIIYFTTP